jgi:GNAT superfamily N-acetyltransferase
MEKLSGYAFVDNNKGSSSSHTIEAKKGFSTAAKVSIEKCTYADGSSEWYIYEVFTKPEFRGQGVAKQIIAYIEKEYGEIVLNSENDSFWEKMGYKRCADTYWRKSSG